MTEEAFKLDVDELSAQIGGLIEQFSGCLPEVPEPTRTIFQDLINELGQKVDSCLDGLDSLQLQTG
jgi:hypothetical protein